MASAQRGAALRHIHQLFGDGTLAGQPDSRLLERYAAERDDTAFSALVQRHGPMVIAVCHGVLDDTNDAEDAFQATFLLLARKAGAIWVGDSLGGWLHRVAWRIALQVKSDASRRRQQERRAAERSPGRCHITPSWDDVCTLIHQEIDSLPERYRKPIVLCYLEDMTYAQAAGRLQWSEATTRGRLARGRDLLKSRLTRRGVTLAGAGLASLGLPKPASAVTAAMVEATVRAARQFVLGESVIAATGSMASAHLVKQAMRTMMLTKLKLAGAAALLVGVLACVATGVAAMAEGRPGGPASMPVALDHAGSPTAKPANGEQPPRAADDENETITFHGRVLLPTGKPAAGAGLCVLVPRPGDGLKMDTKTKADGDGRFRFGLPRSEVDEALQLGPFASITVLATAEGLGPDWAAMSKDFSQDISLQLVEDDVPIAGRILDLEGKPVAGAKITRGPIRAYGASGLDPFLKLVQEDPMRASNHNPAKHFWTAFPGDPANIATDADGRFRLSGIGRDRIVDLKIEGPTIQSATITVMTRAAAAVSSPPGAFAGKTIYGATFEHLVPPGRALTGIVRDQKTKQPLAGVTVCGSQTTARVVTDAQGRYTLPGFPKGKSYGLMVLAYEKSAHFVTCERVADTAGLDPIEVNVDCAPGIPMRLKLLDKETGKPVKGADVFYMPVYPNAHVREVPGYSPVQAHGPYNSALPQDDGTYLLGVLPGPGGVLVRTTEGKYRPACVDPKAFFKAPESKPGSPEDQRYGNFDYINFASGDGWATTPQAQFSAIVLVNPPDHSGPLTAEAVLERDPKREVRVTGPDGEIVTGLTAEGDGAEIGPSGVPTVAGLNPRRPKRFIIKQPAKKLIGCLVARGDEKDPYAVQLKPWATITGRLVDKEGKPRQSVDLMTSDWQGASSNPRRGVISFGQKTGADGRFRYEGLVPGQEYSAHAVGEQAMKGGFGIVIDHVVVKPGETCDLGDVQARDNSAEMKRDASN
jgi:RNA polymerase sigma factor (sigma-70 family)